MIPILMFPVIAILMITSSIFTEDIFGPMFPIHYFVFMYIVTMMPMYVITRVRKDLVSEYGAVLLHNSNLWRSVIHDFKFIGNYFMGLGAVGIISMSGIGYIAYHQGEVSPIVVLLVGTGLIYSAITLVFGYKERENGNIFLHLRLGFPIFMMVLPIVPVIVALPDLSVLYWMKEYGIHLAVSTLVVILTIGFSVMHMKTQVSAELLPDNTAV